MREPCPHCGLRGISLTTIRHDGETTRDIRNHDCPAWAPQSALSIFDTDTSFFADQRNTVEGLRRYRRAVRPPRDCQCEERGEA